MRDQILAKRNKQRSRKGGVPIRYPHRDLDLVWIRLFRPVRAIRTVFGPNHLTSSGDWQVRSLCVPVIPQLAGLETVSRSGTMTACRCLCSRLYREPWSANREPSVPRCHHGACLGATTHRATVSTGGTSHCQRQLVTLRTCLGAKAEMDGCC